MAHYTYSGDPQSSTRDAVRFLVRDTASPWQLSDEEIAYLIAKFGNEFLAAAAGAEVIGNNFTGQVRTKTVGSLSLTYEVKAQAYRDLAKLLKLQANKNIAIAVFAGGISRSDKQAQSLDSDMVDPSFYRGIHDYPGISSEYVKLYRVIDEGAYY